VILEHGRLPSEMREGIINPDLDFEDMIADRRRIYPISRPVSTFRFLEGIFAIRGFRDRIIQSLYEIERVAAGPGESERGVVRLKRAAVARISLSFI
jgi:hypothetical protein